jgi:hypothetical protein
MDGIAGITEAGAIIVDIATGGIIADVTTAATIAADTDL